MNEMEKVNLRNVLALATVDGDVGPEERRFIRRMREGLGVSGEDFRAICEQVRQNPKRLEIPTGPLAAEQTLRLLIDVASADGQAVLQQNWVFYRFMLPIKDIQD